MKRFYKLPFTSNFSIYTLLPLPTNCFTVVFCFIFFACRTVSIAQQLGDTIYLNENFTEESNKLVAAYVQYTLFNTPAREAGWIKTFYTSGEKYSEYLLQNQFIKATGYNREGYKNGQLRYEQQIENNILAGTEKY